MGLPDSGIKSGSLALQVDSLPTEQNLPRFNPVIEDRNHLFIETAGLISTREVRKYREKQYFLILPPVFLSGECHKEMTLVGYSPWDHKESDTTE